VTHPVRWVSSLAWLAANCCRRSLLKFAAPYLAAGPASRSAGQTLAHACSPDEACDQARRLVSGNPRSQQGENSNERSISAPWLVHAAGDLAILDAELAVGRSHAASAVKRQLEFPVAWDFAWRNSRESHAAG
jgi:hypothetical protein